MKRTALHLGLALGLLFSTFTLSTANAQPVDTSKYKETIRVACVGDSITAGVGSKGKSWPIQIGAMLGDKWAVKGFGKSAKTLMKIPGQSYQETGNFKQALEMNPDVVIIMLGTNDSREKTWPQYKGQFEADYKDLVKQFQRLPAKPVVFVCTPPYVPGKGNFGINDPFVLEEIPIVEKVAKEMNLSVIDIHGVLKGQDGAIPDRVHPNADGHTMMSKAIYKALTGKDFQGELNLPEPPKKEGKKK